MRTVFDRPVQVPVPRRCTTKTRYHLQYDPMRRVRQDPVVLEHRGDALVTNVAEEAVILAAAAAAAAASVSLGAE